MHLLECTRLRNKGVHVLTIHNAKGRRSRHVPIAKVSIGQQRAIKAAAIKVDNAKRITTCTQGIPLSPS